jgi:hypothetical protein
MGYDELNPETKELPVSAYAIVKFLPLARSRGSRSNQEIQQPCARQQELHRSDERQL